MAALNPQMLKLGGEIADGVLLNYLPASHVKYSVNKVREGGDAKIFAYVHATCSSTSSYSTVQNTVQYSNSTGPQPPDFCAFAYVASGEPGLAKKAVV